MPISIPAFLFLLSKFSSPSNLPFPFLGRTPQSAYRLILPYSFYYCAQWLFILCSAAPLKWAWKRKITIHTHWWNLARMVGISLRHSIHPKGDEHSASRVRGLWPFGRIDHGTRSGPFHPTTWQRHCCLLGQGQNVRLSCFRSAHKNHQPCAGKALTEPRVGTFVMAATSVVATSRSSPYHGMSVHFSRSRTLSQPESFKLRY